MSIFKMNLQQKKKRLLMQADQINYKMKWTKDPSQRQALEFARDKKIMEVNTIWQKELLNQKN